MEQPGLAEPIQGWYKTLLTRKMPKRPKTFFLEGVFSKQLAVIIKCVSLHEKTMD